MAGGMPDSALAHAAEQGLILLLPTDIYITAGLISFIMTAILVATLPRAAAAALSKPISLGALPRSPSISRFLPLMPLTSLCATAILFFLLIVGQAGPRDPNANLLSLTIWSSWWIGLVVIQGLFGNLWRWINPWTGIYALLDKGLKSANRPKLSNALGVWPAGCIFLLFSLFSIADPAPADPARLAHIVFGYWLFTLIGMLVFGQNPWLKHVECFTIFFNLLAKLCAIQFCSGPIGAGPIGVGLIRAGPFSQKIYLGIPGWAILTRLKPALSLAFFSLAMLAAGSFDGLNETFWWLAKIDVNPLEFPGRSAIILETITGFALSNIILCMLFGVSIWAGNYLANTGTNSHQRVSFKSAFERQALALLPIGFGFHMAHFFTSFLISAQYSFAAMSDPFGSGADYLSLGKIHIYVGFLSVSDVVRWIWWTQAGIIILSHIFAIIIAHRTAHILFPLKRQAQLAELPLTLFMVFYTLFGLWLLGAPRGV